MAAKFPTIEEKDLPVYIEVDPAADKATNPAQNQSPQHLEAASDAVDASTGPSFRHEFGRRYHGFDKGRYFLPNDNTETTRLDKQHLIWKIMFKAMSGRVPITNNIKNVLEIGTGTGIWAEDFAHAHPEINVLGFDLSAIQTKTPPPNLHFLVRNAEEPWDLPGNTSAGSPPKFDYIHMRTLATGINDWPGLLQKIYDHLAPGGWAELNEVAFPPKDQSDWYEKHPGEDAFAKWGRLMMEAAEKMGKNMHLDETLGPMLEKAGFVNVDRVLPRFPYGTWPKEERYKELGALGIENWRVGIVGMSIGLLSTALGMKQEEVEKLNAAVLEDLDRPGRNLYFQMALFAAQKPETAT